jgi:hypothetical protein
MSQKKYPKNSSESPKLSRSRESKHQPVNYQSHRTKETRLILCLHLKGSNLHRLSTLRASSHNLRLTDHDMQLDRLGAALKRNVHFVEEAVFLVVGQVGLGAGFEVHGFVLDVGLFVQFKLAGVGSNMI